MWFNCVVTPGIVCVLYFAEKVDEICVYVRYI